MRPNWSWVAWAVVIVAWVWTEFRIRRAKRELDRVTRTAVRVANEAVRRRRGQCPAVQGAWVCRLPLGHLGAHSSSEDPAIEVRWTP